MKIVKNCIRVWVYSTIGVFFLSSAAFSQFSGMETALSGASYTSWLSQSAVSSGGWISIFQSAITYKGNNPVEEIVQTTLGHADDSDWYNYEKYGYLYTGGKIQTMSMAAWDTTAGEWVASGDFTFTWNGGVPSGFEYAGTLMGMDATITMTFVYDNSDNLISDTTLIGITIGNNTMEILNASEYTYEAGYEIMVQSEWDSDLSEFVPTDKDSTTKCSDDQDSISFRFTWNDPDWVPDERDVMSYNADRKIAEMLTRSVEGGNWADKSKTTYSYGGSAIGKQLSDRMQAARQKAAQKLLSMKGDQRYTALQGDVYNVMGRQSAGRAVKPMPAGVVIVPGQR